MRTVLSPPAPSGIVVLDDGDDTSGHTTSILRSAIDTSTLPEFRLSELPLPLDHPSRKYRSTVPGICYTHPGGLLEGGSGPGSSDPAATAQRTEFVQNLIEEHQHIRRHANFLQFVEKEKQEALKELEERMQARQKAIMQNEDIEAQLVQKKEQRDLEVRVWERKVGMGKG